MDHIIIELTAGGGRLWISLLYMRVTIILRSSVDSKICLCSNIDFILVSDSNRLRQSASFNLWCTSEARLTHRKIYKINVASVLFIVIKGLVLEIRTFQICDCSESFVKSFILNSLSSFNSLQQFTQNGFMNNSRLHFFKCLILKIYKLHLQLDSPISCSL